MTQAHFFPAVNISTSLFDSDYINQSIHLYKQNLSTLEVSN